MSTFLSSHLRFINNSNSSVTLCAGGFFFFFFTFTTSPSSHKHLFKCVLLKSIHKFIDSSLYSSNQNKQSHIALWMQKYQSTLYRKVLLTFVQLQTYNMLHTNTRNIYINQCVCMYTSPSHRQLCPTVQEHFMVFFTLKSQNWASVPFTDWLTKPKALWEKCRGAGVVRVGVEAELVVHVASWVPLQAVTVSVRVVKY